MRNGGKIITLNDLLEVSDVFENSSKIRAKPSVIPGNI